MGGEPTFVSIDDMEGAEWNIAALGPTKKLLAEDLLFRLKRQFAPGGMLHIGQGKWYPGEQLPRWALACYWRKDGEPVWRDEALFGNERDDYDYGPAEAERFISTLARKLGVLPEHAQPAHEDVFYYLWRRRGCRSTSTPSTASSRTPSSAPASRASSARVLDRIAGYACRCAGPGSDPRAAAGSAANGPCATATCS
jgi:uncharacterized protein (DUF2126 family)